MLTDPGAVPRGKHKTMQCLTDYLIVLGNATKENIQRMGFEEGQVIFKCPKCCSIKPDRAHHCSVCQRWLKAIEFENSNDIYCRCIKKMDHHCPWVNNCVGERNQKFFVLFTFYIGMMSYHSLFLGINHFISCLHGDWKTCTAYSPPATVVFILFLLFEV